MKKAMRSTDGCKVTKPEKLSKVMVAMKADTEGRLRRDYVEDGEGKEEKKVLTERQVRKVRFAKKVRTSTNPNRQYPQCLFFYFSATSR